MFEAVGAKIGPAWMMFLVYSLVAASLSGTPRHPDKFLSLDCCTVGTPQALSASPGLLQGKVTNGGDAVMPTQLDGRNIFCGCAFGNLPIPTKKYAQLIEHIYINTYNQHESTSGIGFIQ